MNAQSIESLPFSEGENVADLSSSLGINVPSVEGDHHKLSQEVYDAGLAIIKSKNLEFYEIGMFYDVSDIKLDESLPHKFKGFNVVGRVPDGSVIGDNSIIHSGTDLRNCKIKNNVQAGDDVRLSNCDVGNFFEAGSDIYIEESKIGSRFTAIHIQKIDRSAIGVMFSADTIDNLANENVLAPSHNIKSIIQSGSNNLIIGEDPLPTLNVIGKNNKRVTMTIDDIDEIVHSKDLLLTAKRMAQKNGFDMLMAAEVKASANINQTFDHGPKVKM